MPNRLYHAKAAGAPLFVISPKNRPNETPLKCNRQYYEGLAVQSLHVCRVLAHERAHQIMCNCFQISFFFAQYICLPWNRTTSRRRYLCDNWKKFLPDPVAMIERFVIARIMTIGQPFMI